MNDYGKKGLIGVLTPQANTTVEPELWTLLPTGWSLINARLTSRKNTIESRLIDYTENFEQVVEEFGNAPLNLIASACTGASYLIGAKAAISCNSALVWSCCARHAPIETPSMGTWINSMKWKEKYDLLMGS